MKQNARDAMPSFTVDRYGNYEINGKSYTAYGIVRIINSHQGLLESLRECVQIIESLVDTSKPSDIRLAVSDALEEIAKGEDK